MTDTNRAFVFYAITLALALGIAMSASIIGEASTVVTMFTPAIAALIMLTIVAPEGGIRTAASLLCLNRAGLKAWPVAVAAPTAIHLAGFAMLALTGLATFAAPQMTGSPAIAVAKITVGLFIGTSFALAEEVGWRGYMLPRLLSLGVWPAMLIVGFLHGVWHLPLMLTTDYYHSAGNPLLVVPLFLATLTLVGTFYGFLRLWSKSVWPVAIAHAAANMAWDVMSDITQTKSALVTEYVGGESGLIVIAGLLIFSAIIYLKWDFNKSDRA